MDTTRERPQIMVGVIALSLGLTACGGEGADSEVGDDTGPGSSSDDDSSGEVGDTTLDGPCEDAHHIGGFSVVDERDFGAVSGQVSDAVVPGTTHEVLISDEQCRLLRQMRGTCDPACTSGYACDTTGTCLPYPTPMDAGTVTISGLTEAVIMMPTENGKQYFDTQVSHPPFAEGDDIHMVATGLDTAPFELYGQGVAQLVVEPSAWTLERGKSLSVTWASASNPQAKIQVVMSVDQHGVTPATLVCDFEDIGSGQISAEILDALLDEGTSGFPSASVIRRTVDSTMLDEGCVDFVVQSYRAVDVTMAAAAHY